MAWKPKPASAEPSEPISTNASGSGRTPADASKSIDSEGQLLAEAVRLYEDRHGVVDDLNAETVARSTPGDFEQRIIARARALPIAPTLQAALHQSQGLLRLLVIIGLGLALIAGAGAAQLALGPDGESPVNFFWLTGALLGPPTIALLLWLGLILIKPSAVASGSLGGAVFALGRRLTRRLQRGREYAAAVQATGLMLARGSVGHWTLSLVSHGLWLSYLVGCLLLLILLLSTKQYTFIWETTILSDKTYVAITERWAVIPGALGFDTPDQAQISASRWTGRPDPTAEAARESWSGLLIGSIIVYGLLPRFLALALARLMLGKSRARVRLDTALPGFARWREQLAPTTAAVGVIDPDDRPEGDRPDGSINAAVQPLAMRNNGPIAILGLEIEPPASPWPPLDRPDWLDLGFVDDRRGRQRALEQLRSAAAPPRLIMVVCSLAATPDRGIRDFIKTLQYSTSTPATLVLTEGQRLRGRGDGADAVAQRSADWRRLATQAEIPGERILELDLDHLTEVSRARLAKTLDPAQPPPPQRERSLKPSCALIQAHLERWRGPPSVEQQTDLHLAIASLYQDQPSRWQNLLDARWPLGGNPAEHLPTGREHAAALTERLKASADKATTLLPVRLRANPRWLAAGATAGALGCIAAATLGAGPVAMATLPWWAGLGAAVSAVVPAAAPSSSTKTVSEPTPPELTDAVRSAALFALLLALQGLDEAVITRVIDQTVGCDETVIDGPEVARHWLDGLTDRFTRTLARESGT